MGKTALALRLGERWPIEVVSVDSRQVYRRMDVGTGKPTLAERARVPHHLIDVVEPDERFDAARFAREARAAIADIRARGRWPVLVGGTGLYLRALVRGLAPLPPAEPRLREALREEAARRGPEALHARLRVLDPEAAARLHPRDVVRLVRAIEIVTVTGLSLAAAYRRVSAEEPRPFRWILLGLTMPRACLYARLDARVDRMLETGLLREVAGLLAAGFGPELPSMQGIGYRHLVPVVQGRVPLEAAVRAMKRDTRRYAKRQWTWFAREPLAGWVEMGADLTETAARVEKWVEEAGVFR